ncbi:MAG: carbohydrate kinase family protein [Isosphaerales bacterium]
MKNSKLLTDSAPLAVGTGLVALDVVLADDSRVPARQWAGGTCGNVLLALRYLGWESAPIARFREGHAANRILDDLRRWGASTDFITVADDGSTPVIVQRIGRTPSGEPCHTFSWRCPRCGNRLPGYRPVLASVAHHLAAEIGTPQVFFFDRVSRGALTLARVAASRGAAIVFEPSGVGHPALFREAWEIAHVVKYSHERLQELPAEVEAINGVRIQIETLGRDGLRYRSRLPGCKTRGWQRLEALPAEDVKDTAGAGDWCTAGIVHKLLREGANGLGAVNDAGLREAIRYGQALAAWTCAFEGARGGMYSVEKEVVDQHVERILRGADRQVTSLTPELESMSDAYDCVCPACENDRTPGFDLRGSRACA